MKLILLLAVFLSFNVAAQVNSTLKGNIASETGEPLAGAHVLVIVPEYSVVSDKNGNFQIAGLPAYPVQIHISYLGFECIDQLLIIRNDTTINYRLTQSTVMLHDVVITGNDVERRKKEQSTDIEIINRDYLFRNTQSTLMKSLEKISGVSSIDIGQGFSKPVVRGLSFNRVAVVENGIKQQGQQWGADHGLEIDQFNISEVEISKGPASLSYGSDAIGGVIVLEQPRLSAHDGVEAGLLLIGKSVNDHIGASLNVGYQKKGKYIKARYTYQDYGDYRIPADSFMYLGYKFPIYNQMLKNTAGTEQNLNISAGWVTNRIINSLTFSSVNSEMGFFAGAHGIPSIYKLSDDGNTRNIGLPYQTVKHNKIISSTKFRRGSGHMVTINAGYQMNRRKEYSSPHSHGYEPVPEGNLELDFKLQTATLNVDHKINTSDRNIINFGLNSEGQHNTIAGYSFLLPEFNQVTAGLYFSDTYNITEKLMINGGVRFDYGFIDIKQFIDPYIEIYLTDSLQAAKYKVRSPAIKNSLADITYAAGLVYSLSALADVKINIGKSFRMPTANELSSNGIHHGTFRHEMGDSTLNSEKSYQFDATFDYHIEKTRIVLGGFANYFPNFIFLNPSGEFSFLPDAGQIYKYVQSGAFRTGGELQFKTELFNRFDINIAAEYVFAIDLENNYPIPFTPPLNVLSEIGYLFKNTGYFKNSILMASYQVVTAQNQVARNELPTPGYNVLGIALSSDLNLKSTLIKLSFRIDNIFDTKYYNHLSFYRPLDLPEAGRSFQLTMKIPIIKQVK